MAHDCGDHGFQIRKWVCRTLIGLAIGIPIVAIILIIVFCALPTKPEFTIQDATLHTFNVSTDLSVVLTSTIQVTITSRNPNDHSAIIYDNLGVFATYRDQQITLTSIVQSVYQDHNEVNVWSPFLFGNLVPIAPYNAIALAQDQNLQVVNLMIVLNGRVRYKVGAITHGKCHLRVKCPARLTFGSRSTGILVGNAVKYQLVESCTVSV